jgi:sigma-B regulation protein RsbU (phosphoserine phosphatase)
MIVETRPSVLELEDRRKIARIINEKFQQDIEIGSQIQRKLLLAQPPRDLLGMHVAALTIPSQWIDGDFYEFIKHNNQCFDVIIGDAMGKGIPAGLLGAGIKNHFLRASLLSEEAKLPEPEEIVTRVHTEVTRQLIGLESFTTLCYARFDRIWLQLDLVDCGHTKTIHYQHRTGRCYKLQGGNMPLGFKEEEVYKQISLSFEPEDIFLFYSDGITEAQNKKKELFGIERLAACVRLNSHLEPKELTDRIRAAVSDFSGSETFADDLTCIAVKIEETGGVLLSHKQN